MKNLYFEPEYSKKLSELRGDLLEWLVTTTRPNKHSLGQPPTQPVQETGRGAYAIGIQ